MDANLLGLFRYDAWADDRTLSSIRDQGDSGEDARKLFSHVLAGRLLWLSRLLEEPPTVPVWPAMTMTQMERFARELLLTCARQYIKFPSLYDVAASVALVSEQDIGLVVQFVVAGVSKDISLQLIQKFLSRITWQK